MEIDSNGLEVLDRDDCLRLLASSSLGRVGVTSGALPTVLPVNFRLRDDEVLIRTSTGSKLDAAIRGAVVAFEVDDFDPLEHSGWSVVVTGVARELTDDEVASLGGVPLIRWVPVEGEHVVGISTEMVSGRRIRRSGRRPRRTARPSRVSPES